MATLAARSGFRLNDERRFFGGMALLMVVLTFIGFAPSYYLSEVFGGRPLSPVLHIHGVVFTAWMLLFVVQTGLVSAGRSDLHRLIGPVVAVLAVAMVPLGVATAILVKQAIAAHHLPPSGPPLIFPLGAIFTFAVLTAAGIAMRARSAWHKRLMLLGTIAILTTPLARITKFSHLPLMPAYGGILLTDILLAMLVAYDLRTRGKLHPATLWGGGFFLLTQVARVVLNLTPAWQSLSHSVTG
ncbi:hypothetical protein [Sphingomonas sp. KR3-1]|uniref:hypothetical protein n=1 Tax=Sphingomonas sp. KR3-1 TaxID=3156611 RepID=UPI0032B4E456